MQVIHITEALNYSANNAVILALPLSPGEFARPFVPIRLQLSRYFKKPGCCVSSLRASLLSPPPPSGPLWLHEIKHDGFRVIACKDGAQVRLYSRPGNDLTKRFPLIAETLAQLRCKSCVIDGEAVACGADGRSNFDLIRYRHHDEVVFLYAFDLLRSGSMTCGAIHWRFARPPWSRCWPMQDLASDITSTSRAMPKISSGTPAS